MSIPLVKSKICSCYEGNIIHMYEVVFKEMGFRMPFLDFQKEVMKWLELAPSQLHPNSMDFVRSFKLMCEYLEMDPTIPFSSLSSPYKKNI